MLIVTQCIESGCKKSTMHHLELRVDGLALSNKCPYCGGHRKKERLDGSKWVFDMSNMFNLSGA